MDIQSGGLKKELMQKAPKFIQEKEGEEIAKTMIEPQKENDKYY